MRMDDAANFRVDTTAGPDRAELVVAGEVDERLTIDRLLSSLPPRERAIVELRFFAGLTQSEIAERVGLSQMHISRLLTQSLGRLREHAPTTPT